jgi:hypothetical protein
MLNIYEIIKILVPEYQINRSPLKKQVLVIKQIEKTKMTNFECLGTFKNLFSCLLYQHENLINNNLSDKYDNLDEEKYESLLEDLKEFMEKYEFNPLINVKKMLNLIGQNIINNELILFLSGYFNVNIYVYSFESKLLKIYYLEDKLNINKESIVLVMKKDLLTPNIGYQTLVEKKKFKYNDNFIQDLSKDIYIIAIGLKENKKLELEKEIQNDIDMIENKLFIIGKKESEKIVIDDNIFNDLEINNYLEDDVEGNLYDPLEFKINIKKIYKKYSKENLMKEICKYY